LDSFSITNPPIYPDDGNDGVGFRNAFGSGAQDMTGPSCIDNTINDCDLTAPGKPRNTDSKRGSSGSAPVPQPDMELDIRAADSSEQSTLLRVVSLLLPKAVWVLVKNDGTLGDMYQCVLEGITRESPLIAELRSPLQIHLMDPRDLMVTKSAHFSLLTHKKQLLLAAL